MCGLVLYLKIKCNCLCQTIHIKGCPLLPLAISKWDFVFSLSYGVWPDNLSLLTHSAPCLCPGTDFWRGQLLVALLPFCWKVLDLGWVCKPSCFSVPPLFAPGRFSYQQVAVTGCHLTGAGRTRMTAGGSGSAEIYMVFGVWGALGKSCPRPLFGFHWNTWENLLSRLFHLSLMQIERLSITDSV